MPSNLPKIVARTDEQTIKKFQYIASKESRTMSKQIVFMVKEYIDKYEKENGTIKI